MRSVGYYTLRKEKPEDLKKIPQSNKTTNSEVTTEITSSVMEPESQNWVVSLLVNCITLSSSK